MKIAAEMIFKKIKQMKLTMVTKDWPISISEKQLKFAASFFIYLSSSTQEIERNRILR